MNSLRAADRASLSAQRCDRAIATMRTYFQPGKPVYSWFRSLDRVARGFGVRYDLGEVPHLDPVQEATQPTWSGLSAQELARLLAADEPFMRWQLKTFPLEVVICNGRSVFAGVQTLMNAQIVQSGKLARVTWYVALSAMPGRVMGVVGWNIPLARPAGLDKAGHAELGRLQIAFGKQSTALIRSTSAMPGPHSKEPTPGGHRRRAPAAGLTTHELPGHAGSVPGGAGSSGPS